MKKSWRIYGWTWVAVIAATLALMIGMFFHTSHHELADDPRNLEKIVKVDLPGIVFCYSDNNLERGSSRWDIFEHRGKFVHEISEETIMVLDKLCQTDSKHWHKAKDGGGYSYYDEGGVDGLYTVFCLISKDGFTINYEVDESEGILVLLPFVIVYSILFKWGIVLIIIALIRRIKNRNKR